MRPVRAAVAAAVTIAVLSGCARGETANETLPEASPSATETSEALPQLGPPDLPMPPEAREQSAAGVEAFARYYIELSNHLLESLESQPLRDLSSQCSTCDQLADGYDDSQAQGLTYVGGEIAVVSTGTAMVDTDDAEIPLLLSQSPVRVIDNQGKDIPERATDTFQISGGMTLDWDPSRSTWIVTDWTADRL